MSFPSSSGARAKGVSSRFRPFSFAALAVLATFTACSDDDGDATPVQPQQTQLTVAVTDAVTDDLVAFEADVRQLTLTSSAGSRTFVLRERARVDFTALESTAEVLGSAPVDPGTYTGMEVVFDFADAQVWIVDQTTPATIVGPDGAAIAGPVPVQVAFASGSELVLGGQRDHLLVLDLDLESSLAVDRAANRVTFAPVVVATLDPQAPKPLFLAGTPSRFDGQAGTFTIETKSQGGNGTGTFPVVTGASTTFTVDGRSQSGPAGFTSLNAGTGAAERIGVRGTWNAAQRTIVASHVESGAGTMFGGQDVVVGHVVARAATAGSDTTLTVFGRSFEQSARTRMFNTIHTVAVRLGQTRVVRAGSTAELDTDDVNVGQRIAAFGDLTGTNLDAFGGGATPAAIALLPTAAVGTASGPVAGDVLTMVLERFDTVSVDMFAFQVGGFVEADPSAYRVDVRGLQTGTVESGTRVRAAGTVNPVGIVGDPDFTATAAGGRRDATRVVDVRWSPATAGAFTDASATGLVLNLAGTASATVGDRFAQTALTPAPAPAVRPAAGRGAFVLVTGRTVASFRDFPAFAEALRTRILAGGLVHRLVAAGTFAEATQELTASSVAVIVSQP